MPSKERDVGEEREERGKKEGGRMKARGSSTMFDFQKYYCPHSVGIEIFLSYSNYTNTPSLKPSS